MPRTDTATGIVPADVSETFAALTSREALETWLPPAGMTGSIEDFDASEGGGYRMTLTYPEALSGHGKTTANTDVVNVRYLKIIANESVTQEGSFESENPEFTQSGMTMTWTVEPARRGTQVTVRAENVPDTIDAEEHAQGLNQSLANLAQYLTK